MNRMRVFLVVLSLTVSVVAQIKISKTDLHGREAFTLENDRAQLSVLSGGGYIGEVRFKSDDPKLSVNPMRVPHYQTIDPHTYDPAIHDELYGQSISQKHLAGYMGSYLCFPYFGAPDAIHENKPGLEHHGEAPMVKWEMKIAEAEDGASVLESYATLPLTEYSISRRISVDAENAVFLVEEEIENLQDRERPYQWLHHITFGNPFIEYGKSFADAPVANIFTSRDRNAVASDIDWPLAVSHEGERFNASLFRSNTGETAYHAWRFDPSNEYCWVTAYHTEFKALIGFVFQKELNPWLVDWQENCRAQSKPWSGKSIARALVMGTTPFGNGIKQSIDAGPLLDTETYARIGPNGRKQQSYLIFLLEVDEGFKGVQSLALEGGSIEIVERDTGKALRIESRFEL